MGWMGICKGTGKSALKITILSMQLDSEIDISHASRIRGFIGNLFKQYPVLHHHINQLGYIYEYPRIQYKVIGGQPMIVGINSGEILREIASNLDRLDLGREYSIRFKTITEFEESIGPSQSRVYEFITPWIALNEENWKKYCDLPREKRMGFLSKIMVGNVLSMCKSLSYVVESRLRAAVFVREGKVKYKGLGFTAFSGRFIINFDLPSYIGIGKGTSQGFGTLRKVEG